MLTHSNPATAHQFARSKNDGKKYFFPFGAASARMLAVDLPSTPQFAAIPVQCETCESIQPARQMHPHATGLQCHTCKHGTARQLVREIAGTTHDLEFYPTTQEIINSLVASIRGCSYARDITSALDIGAGSGKVLCALRDAESLHISDLYAIEKSTPLLQAMPPDIMTVGTDFMEQSLLSKPVHLTFCNPPYSQFQAWAVKIIQESTSQHIYLVIPQRWKDSPAIQDAIKAAGKKARTVRSFDFENAEDRTARAKVDLVHLTASDEESRHHYRSRHDEATAPHPAFQRQFDSQFADFIKRFKQDDSSSESDPIRWPSDKGKPASRFDSIVPGENYAAALVALYNAEMAHVQKNYAAAMQLDPDLLREFDINPGKICHMLHQRLKGLRNVFWKELFERFDTISSKLTAASRSRLLTRLHQHVHVDFTLSNIEAVVLWVLKNANKNFDTQLIEVFEELTAKCNVKLYKSNQRVFVEKGWRYEKTTENTHYSLDYRIITHHSGGTSGSSYRGRNGLDDRAHVLLEDIRTVAANLGFTRSTKFSTSDFHWQSGQSHTFSAKDPATGATIDLFRVRAFGNGNMHFKFNQRFILALNVEHGRLKGWLKTPAEAAEEMQDPAAATMFKSNLALPASYNPLQLAA
jgi:hypothetical protein